MERIREGRRAAVPAASVVTSATRRPRIKDVSDEEDRLDEAIDPRTWERPKKERLTTLHVSTAANPRNKRKRQALPQEAQAPGRAGGALEDADESVEETEAAASEDDDEPPPPPHLRRPGKARVHMKEDEMVMDIPAVPRKARSSISSSSRFSSMLRRLPENLPADIARQKSPATTQTFLNGSSSPNFLQKQGRKPKPVGSKVRAMKAPKVSEPSTISDQEVEVAEALFVLARSMPSYTGLLESKVDAKLEPEARRGSPPLSSLASTPPPMHGTASLQHTSNGFTSSHIKDTIGPVAEAPKRKRPRVVVKQEDGRASTPVRLVVSGAVSSSVSTSVPFLGETEAEPPTEKTPSVVVDMSKVKSPSDVSHPIVSRQNSEERKIGHLESESIQLGDFKAPKQDIHSNVEIEEEFCNRYEKVKSPSGHHLDAVDGLLENDGRAKQDLSSRNGDGGISKLNIDLMASPMKHFSLEDEVSSLPNEKQTLDHDTSINSAGCNVEANAEEAKQRLGLAERDVDKRPSKPKEITDVENQELKLAVEYDRQQKEQLGASQFSSHQQKEQMGASQISRDTKEEDKEKEVDVPKIQSRSQKDDTDNAVASSTLSTAASSSAPVLAGWMGGLPQLGYYGPGATPWAPGASLPTSSLDLKAAHSAMQLPHGALLSPVLRMKRCATHVYMAHFIFREQQVSRHSLWSAALCRAAPYNLNIPPGSMLDNEKLGGHYMDITRKASAQQSGPSYGYTVSQAAGPGMPGSSNGAVGTISASNHTSSGGVAADNGAGASSTAASGNVMAAHAQYLQAMMQQNGFASFPFPFNGPPGQAAQFFNSPFFPPHLIPPIPHLQPLGQQAAANVLPVQKQQQGIPPANTTQLMASPLQQQQQQQLQLQLAPQSPSQSQQQQHSHVATSGQHFGIHSEKESTGGTENLSETVESRRSTMQRSMCGQVPLNLPNLNMSPSSLMLASNMPTIPSHDQDVSTLATLGQKQTGKPQHSYQGQSLPSSVQQQQFITQTGGSGSGLPMKVFDSTFSQGYSNRGSVVGPGPLGLVSSVSSMMGTQGHGVLPGSNENTKGHVLQQQSYGGHSQQFQRSMTKAPSVSDAVKGLDYTDDKKATMKQVGAPPLLSRGDMEVSSPSLQGSPTSGGGVANARLLNNVGRTLSSVTPPDIRSSRPASAAGSGQAPLLQNQPPKQAVGRTKPGSGANVAPTPAAHSVASYVERVLPGNLGKFAGNVLPFSGQMVQTTQGPKPSHNSMVKVGQQRLSPGPTQPQAPTSAMAKGQVQHARSNQQGVPSTPPRMLPSVSGPMLSSGTLSMSTSHSLSAPKTAVVTASKSPSNGKGAVSVTKPAPPTKKPHVTGPATASMVSPGQNVSVRAPAQQKSQALAHVPQFLQQQPSVSAQQRVGAKNQVYSQLQPQQGQYKQPFQSQAPYRPQLFLQQHHQQYMQQSSSQQQQQGVPPHTQIPVSHHYQPGSQNLPTQHSQAPQHIQNDSQLPHLQQQFQPVTSLPQTSAASNGLSLSSSSLTLGTTIPGNMTSGASLDGAGSRTNPSKAVYTSGSLPSSGMPEIITTAHPSVAGQASSPHGGSSQYLQQTLVKSSDSKALPDSTNREETASARHLPSPSSQAAPASNPTSS